jgi:hypothetical protein
MQRDDDPGPIGVILDAVADRIQARARRLAKRIREKQQPAISDQAVPEQAELIPVAANETVRLAAKKPVPPSRQITDRRADRDAERTVTPDTYYLADLEISDGQRMKRMADRDKGKRVKRPEPR